MLFSPQSFLTKVHGFVTLLSLSRSLLDCIDTSSMYVDVFLSLVFDVFVPILFACYIVPTTAPEKGMQVVFPASET